MINRLQLGGVVGMPVKSSIAHRRTVAKESFKTAADCIGEIRPNMSLFAVTRGQFSMLDAVLHVLDQVGRAKLTIWTWTIAEYEVERFKSLQADGRLYDSTLIVDGSARRKNAKLIEVWKAAFGCDSVRYVSNHSKIATIEGGGLKLLLRGSMNLNFNPRFEQFDITEGGADFDLVKQIEAELPILEDNCSGAEIYKASRVSEAFDLPTLGLFNGIKKWAK